MQKGTVWCVTKESLRLKFPYKRKDELAVPEYRKQGFYYTDIPRATAFVARVKNGKLYDLMDRVKIPRDKVRVTSIVKKTRKQAS